MNITDSIQVNDTVAETFSYGDVNASVQGQALLVYTLNNGTTVGLVDLHYESPVPVTLAAGATLTLILSALVDGQGRTVAFARAVEYFLRITARTDGDYLTVGGAPTHPWTAIETHKVYDCELKVANTTAGLVVTAGVSDQLLITNSGSNPITFKLKLAGRSV